MKTQKHSYYLIIVPAILIFSFTLFAGPMGTVFTYQGRLLDANIAADGEYDMQFKLYDALIGGNQVGSAVMLDNVAVDDGYFIAELDFGSGSFDGDGRWLQIAVRPGSSTNPYTPLTPLQPLTPAPYALYASQSPVGSKLWSATVNDIYNINSGNVGIGTSSPAGTLHVATPAVYSGILFVDAGSGQDDLSLDTTSAFTDVVSRVYAAQASSASGDPDQFIWSDDSGATWSSDQPMTTDWFDLSHGVRIKWDDTNGHVAGDGWIWIAARREPNALVVKNGNVGIGTSMPNWELEVANLRPGDGAESAVTADDASGAIAAYSSTLGSPFSHYAGRVSLFSDQVTEGLDLRADNSTGDIRFYTGGISADNQRMQINSAGNVGIGTDYALSTLTIGGIGVSSSSFYASGRDTGVYATGLDTGVYARGDEYGARCYGDVYGVYASGDEYGVHGVSSRSGDGENIGVYARALSFSSSTNLTYAVKAVVQRTGSSGNHWSGHFTDSGSNGTYYGLYADLRTGDAIDLAEYILDTEGNTEAGDVLVADPDNNESVIKASKPYDPTVVGIVSTQPHMVMGMELIMNEETGEKYEDVNATMLALAGRVPVKVTNENGPIKRGDLLTTSSKPGYAMKWTPLDVTEATDFEQLTSMLAENEKRSNTIVAKALENSDSIDGTIIALLNVQ